MGNFPVIKPNELIKILESRGFVKIRQSGSHLLLRRDYPTLLRVTVPIHNKPLKRGTLLSILKQANLKKEDLSKRK